MDVSFAAVSVMRAGLPAEESGGNRRARRVTQWSLALWLGTTCSWMLAALLRLDLPFFAWFPFDTTHHYAEAFIYQLVTANLVVVIISGLDCFCLELMMHLSERLQTLNKLFRSFATDNARQQPQLRMQPSTPASHRGKSPYGIITKKSFMKWVVAPLDVHRKPAKAINSLYSRHDSPNVGNANGSFKHCIQYHWELIELKKETEKFCGVVLFFQILASMFIICFVTFQATVNTMDAGSLTKCVMYLSVALLQLGLFCNEGTNIVTQSEELMLAVYSSEWPDCDAALKQSVIVTMMRLQYPLQIRAASYCTLSFETFSKILHTSYTFFTLLRQVSETQ
uniref:Odorant receptor 6 n=1 Tax=Locusta migratoria TaxID=7004 RepID=A0A0M3SBN7_LOCMI|nr:odorant receptor 6 [Locusta migratoria]